MGSPEHAITDTNGTHDVVVIGGGILGLATAREIAARRPDAKITVLEKEPEVAMHQTGHNSGVVHAGIYYVPGSLKARLCVEGARLLYDYCDRHDLPVERCGKVVVATHEGELARLDELERRARSNAVPGIRRLDANELLDLEPHATGIAALHSPATGIVDFSAVARAMAADVRSAGGVVATNCAVESTERRNGGLVIRHTQGEIHTRQAVFCAGLWSDRLAVNAGAPRDPRIVPFRGAYLRLRPERRSLVRSLIYPVPDPALPFLGVHLTRHIDGEVLIGPTALLVAARDAYSLRRASARDMVQTLGWPGSWRMFARWWRTGLLEMSHAASRRRFVAAAARYVPALRPDDVLRGPAGVRAQALGRDGKLVDDFVISETYRALHVRNAPSPAATSSLAIASMIAERAAAAAN
jgi:2-hydroxyglutarate dehydrogenase